ncbi:MAG: asparagine--tRNA ligase [Saprospiraceae bacterium]|nr:asparagine--tRNA ligase [Saprospiraceae bacterium]
MVYIEQLQQFEGQTVTLKGWQANMRESKGLLFIVLRDGSGFCQCVVNLEEVGEDVFNELKALSLESSMELTGLVKKDDRQIGGYEVQVTNGKAISASIDYPIAKKEHGVDFLMDKRHLWLRSRRQWALMRIRNAVTFEIHAFFQNRGFMQMDAPLLTPNAAEGTSTLFDIDFYGRPAYLSQSGQLYGEAMAMAMGRIYTFGPTFRAEKSKTRRHLSEFWMIEPEMAFFDNDMNMDLMEDMIREVVTKVIEKCRFELTEVLERDLTKLETVAQKFPRITYTEAVHILKGNQAVNGKTSIEVLQDDLAALQKQIADNETEIADKQSQVDAGGIKKGKLNWLKNKIDQLKVENKELQERADNIPQWLESAKNFTEGEDFGGSDETVLTRLFDSPVMVYNWPTPIKAFYMKEVEGDPNFVKGVDLLAPEGYGEIVGGSERETDIEVLLQKIKAHNLPQEVFEWYLDLRRYGSVPHSGFGLGLERLITWISGTRHIRETIPFPRLYGRVEP